MANEAADGSRFFELTNFSKIKLTEKIHVLAGPCVNYFLDAKEDVIKFNADLGTDYDITEKIDMKAKYSLDFSDVIFSGIFIGADYSF